MLPDLLRQERIRNQLDEVVDRVDGRVDGLEPLDLLPDRQGVVQQSRGRRPAADAGRRRRRHVVLVKFDHSVTLCNTVSVLRRRAVSLLVDTMQYACYVCK